MSNRRILMGALTAANRIRRYMGLPPVKELYGGQPGKGESCPITNTIYDDDVDREQFSIFTGEGYIRVGDRKSGKHKTYRNTVLGSNFVSEFDKRYLRDEFPDLYSKGRIKLID